MKAPDSVYLSELLLSSMTLRDYDEDRIQYIRKDTLLEWAKKEQYDSDTILQDDFWQKVIDKLNNF